MPRFAISIVLIVCLVLQAAELVVAGQSTNHFLADEGVGVTAIRRNMGLTDLEIRWLVEHPKLRLGIDPSWEPYELVADTGEYQGMLADYMRLLERRLGISLTPVSSTNWNQTLHLVESGQIDVSSGLIRTPQREEFLSFTQPYMKLSVAVATLDTHSRVSSLAPFAGKKVALPRSYYFSDLALRVQPDIIPVYVNTVFDGLKLVANREADAVLCDMPSMSYKIREYNLLNLKIAGFIPFEIDGLRMGVRKDWPILTGILDKALKSISKEDVNRIRERWIGQENRETALELTVSERKWLQENPVIRVMVDPDWAPIEYLDKKGVPGGVTSEYLNRISQMLNVRFEPVQGEGWAQMAESIYKGDIMMASCMRKSDVRSRSLFFTQDYLTMPTGIFTRNDVTFSDMKGLSGKAVAIVKGHAVFDYVKSMYPKVVILEAGSRREGLELVSNGKAYAYLDSLPVGCHGISSFRFTNVRLTGEVSFPYDMAMAVSKRYPELHSVLCKALEAIPESDRNSYYEKWFSSPDEYRVDSSIIWKIVISASAVILFFIFWNRKLEQRVKMRTSELAQAKERLENELLERKKIEEEQRHLEEQLAQAQKMESIGRLAGGVAHDFNNMLCVIMGHGELLKKDLPRDAVAQESLNQIMEAGERARNITQQLLAFSRKQILQIQVIDLNRVVRDMETMIRRLLGEDIKMVIRVESEALFVKADSTRLEQVILNLCVNARDAMPDGGNLVLETRPVVLDESFALAHPGIRDGSYVRLSVSDTGCGMNPETIQKIFDPFFTTKDISKGTGLGLAMVYGIVKQHGGEIVVESVPGRGTSFFIYLPRTYENLEEQKLEAQKQELLSRGETILVVEDEPALRKLTAFMLERLGYNVIVADVATQSAASAARAKRVDLLLTDVIMPELNGRQVQKEVLAVCPTCKTLFMSGYTDEVIDRHGVLEKGASFIAKPFTLAALSRKIREILDA